MTLDEYLALPYTLTLRRDDEGDFIAIIDELPGCVAHGKTRQVAVRRIESMQREWIVETLERGGEIPLPAAPEDQRSGRWVQRTSPDQHQRLAAAARRSGVSLNTLVCTILAEFLGGQANAGAPRFVAQVEERLDRFEKRLIAMVALTNAPLRRTAPATRPNLGIASLPSTQAGGHLLGNLEEN